MDRLASTGRSSASQNVKSRIHGDGPSSSSTTPSSPATTPAEEREAGASSPVSPVSSFSPSTPAQSALPGDGLPKAHVETIMDIFGSNGDNGGSPRTLDLYRDVLRVSPTATDREIRIAYFRRGREVLSEGGFQSSSGTGPVQAGDSLDVQTRATFQAVSMAYEILSTPAWREAYLKHGLCAEPPPQMATQHAQPQSQPQPDAQDSSLPEGGGNVSAAPTDPTISNNGSRDVDSVKHIQKGPPGPSAPISALRSASSSSSLRVGRRPSNGGGLFERDDSWGSSPPAKLGVRWKEHVEEMLFENHPNEHAPSFDDDEDDDIIDDDYDGGDDFHGQDGRKVGSPISIGSNSTTETGSRNGRQTTNSSSGGGSNAKKRKKSSKQKVVIESDELETHLLRMDNEAEKHFVFDFFDNFEESLDGIISMVDSFSSQRASRLLLSKNRHAVYNKSLSAPGKDRSTWSIGKSLSHDSADLDRKKSPSNDDSSEIKRSNSYPPDGRDASVYSASANSTGHPFADDAPQVHVVDTESPIYGSDPTSPTKSASSATLTPSASGLTPVEVTPDNSPAKASRSAFPLSSSSGARLPAQPEVSPSEGTTEAVPSTAPPVSSKATCSTPRESIPDDSLHRMHDSPAAPPGAEQLAPDSRPTFRPISPVNPHGEDQFELESLNLSEMENAFREKVSAHEPQETAPVEEVDPLPSDVPSRTNKRKNKRVSISMVTSARSRNYSPPLYSKGKVSKSEDLEDVFDGLDDAKKYAMVGDGVPVTVRGRDVSLKRTSGASSSALSDCFSDLSESIAASGRSITRNASRESDLSRATTPTSTNETRGTGTTLMTSTSFSSRDTFSAMDVLSIASGDASGPTLDSTAETAGFFDYFLAYVTAIVTECAAIGSDDHDFHQDFIGLFCDADLHGAEKREPA